MILSMLLLGLVLGLARARWWGILLAGVLFVVDIAAATDNAWYTWPASYLLAVVNAGVAWLVGAGLSRGAGALFARRPRGRRVPRTDDAVVAGNDDGPPPEGRAVA